MLNSTGSANNGSPSHVRQQGDFCGIAIERLNAGLHCKLTLISAPAGFGKTTLLSEWVSGRGRSQTCPYVAWLSLDEGDNDPARFLAYLVAALQMAEPGLGQSALTLLQSAGSVGPPAQSQTETMLTVLMNEIAEGECTLILVLDDYHLITSPTIHDSLAFLLDHLPNNVHLVIATRADPPLPLARLRGRGQLTELRQADLRFTLDETAEFLRRGMNLQIAAGHVATLTTRTEGWIAGLQMAATSIREREDLPGFIEGFTGSDRYILDYLVEEVLQRQPEDVQVLQLVAEGCSNREISQALFLSLNTVKGHTRNIRGKLGVHSRTQAVAKARAFGLLSAD